MNTDKRRYNKSGDHLSAFIRVYLRLILLAALLLSGCANATQIPGAQQTPEATPSASSTAATATATLASSPQATAYPGPGQPTSTVESYPGPVVPTSGTPSPAPGLTGTLLPYPGAETTVIPAITTSPTSTRPTGAPFGTPTTTLSVTGTITATATERPITTAEPPPQPQIKTVSIWHSWNTTEQQVLDYALRSFQSIYPDIRFMVTYYPEEQLQAQYAAAAYAGAGPSLVFGPAGWGPSFYDQELIVDVSSIADPAFLATINPAALDEARYKGALIGLPNDITEGVVIYRNPSIVPRSPSTFDELIQISQAATGVGKVGAYLETSFMFSGGNLPGIGGQFMDENGLPAFNSQAGLDWLALLDAYEQVGISRYNTDRDVELFKAGKAGIIIDSTLRQGELAAAIGTENLAIDPWPSYGSGTLSGFIQTDNMYLNSRTTGDERYSALLLMGFFLAKEVQAILSTAGHIPAVMDVAVEDPLMQQAMVAFEKASAYPIQPEFALYVPALEQALFSYFELNANPGVVLNQAEQEVLEALEESRP